MFTRIVVGTNGSDEAHDALRLSEALASITGAEVLIVHAYPIDPFEGAVALAAGGRPLRESAEELLGRETGFGPPGARTLAVAGSSPARVLQRVADAEHADLLVVGSSRRGTVGRVLLGDDARQTMHHATCAVAIAPRGYESRSGTIAAIGVGYDGSPDAQHALGIAAQLAAKADGRLRLVAAVAPPFEGAITYAYPYPIDWTSYYAEAEKRLRQELDDAVAGLAVPATGEVEKGWAPKVLEELSGECDLLVVGSRHWGAVNRLLLGSTATALVGNALCPLLVVPRTADGDESE